MQYLQYILDIIPAMLVVAVISIVICFILNKFQSKKEVPILVVQYLLISWLLTMVYVTQLLSFG